MKPRSPKGEVASRCAGFRRRFAAAHQRDATAVRPWSFTILLCLSTGVHYDCILMKTGIFIGRFQPFHDGHRKCIQKILEQCDRCIVMMRETGKTEKNPFDLEKRRAMIRAEFPDAEQVIITDFQDPGAELAVYIGRNVGYELIQLDEQTEAISATDIRKKLYEEAGKEYDRDAPLKVK